MGGATTYTALLHKLNSIQQAHGKLAKDYYERVVQIRVKLQEFHCYMFRPGDLECQAKEVLQQIASRVPVNGSAQEG